jgi:hypothetical protein
LINRRRCRIGGRGGSVRALVSQRDAGHPAAGDRGYGRIGDSRKDVIEAVGVVELLGNLGERHRQAGGWSVGLSPLRRFIPIGSRCGQFSPRVVSALPRPRPFGTGLSPRRSSLSPFSGNAKLRSPGVQLPFPLVELRLPAIDGPVPGVSHPVALVSDLISPVSNEVALLSGPRALFVA